MARIRTIKPGFFLNEQLAELPYEDRLLFIGLWTQADRAGRLEDRPLRLKATLFPYDDLMIDDCLGRLAHAGLILRYERGGMRLIAIPSWEKHQQPHFKEIPSELPAPDQPEARLVLAAQEQEGKGTGREQEGNGTPTRADALREGFDQFWSLYPRKTGKDAAWRIWLRLKPSPAMTTDMLAAIREQQVSPQWVKDGGQFIPHPRTWLNQGRWQDEPVNVPQMKDQTVKNVEAVRRWAES